MNKILITGGAGFVGSNLARALLDDGHEVVILDNLTRAGVRSNAQWLKTGPGKERLTVRKGDVRRSGDVVRSMAGVDTVFHLAAQVAVTTSVTEPRNDFEVNALGTVNVLEAVRQMKESPRLVFTSTNKVYGGLEHRKVRKSQHRCRFSDGIDGIAESEPLDFHSPYGCSKGSADQYVRDYGRIYGLKTTVLRMSCIYGTRQFGTEDQGWVAHFMIRAAQGLPVTVYGDGKQVRDILYVSDLVRAFKSAASAMDRGPGGVFNIGGGPNNTLSLRELLEALKSLYGRKVKVKYGESRPGDQPIYVSDIDLARRRLRWQPKIDVARGLELLSEWVPEAIRLSS